MTANELFANQDDRKALQDAQERYDETDGQQISSGYHYCSLHDRVETNGSCKDAIALGEDETNELPAL